MDPEISIYVNFMCQDILFSFGFCPLPKFFKKTFSTHGIYNIKEMVDWIWLMYGSSLSPSLKNPFIAQANYFIGLQNGNFLIQLFSLPILTDILQ